MSGVSGSNSTPGMIGSMNPVYGEPSISGVPMISASNSLLPNSMSTTVVLSGTTTSVVPRGHG